MLLQELQSDSQLWIGSGSLSRGAVGSMESGDEHKNHTTFETSGGLVYRCLHTLADLAIRHMVSDRSRR